MDRYERILTLHRILKVARYPVPFSRLKDELACSRATLYRDIAFLRDALGAPIEGSDGDAAAFRYAADEADRFELPGLWLSSEELAALLALNELLGRSDPGVLAGALAPFRARIERLLSDHSSGRALPIERIRVFASGSRTLDQAAFRDRSERAAQPPAPEVRLPRALDRCADRAHRLAAAPRALPRQLVSGCLGPQPRWPAQFCARPHPQCRMLLDEAALDREPAASSTRTSHRATASSPAHRKPGRRSVSRRMPRAGSPTSTGIRSSRDSACPTAATS